MSDGQNEGVRASGPRREDRETEGGSGVGERSEPTDPGSGEPEASREHGERSEPRHARGADEVGDVPSSDSGDHVGAIPHLDRRRLLGLAGGAAASSAVGTGAATVGGATAASERAGDYLVAPGSAIAPTDGYADAGWLAEESLAVETVTTLAPTGEGSLQAALDATGPRVVVFEVGGVIDLDATTLTVEEPQVYVAGQTAPDPGITVVRGEVAVEADQVVLQHLRSRPGDGTDRTPNCLHVEGTDVIVDHCSLTWSVDWLCRIAGVWGPGDARVTITNCLLAEALADAGHHFGEHSNGLLVGPDATEVAVLGSLLASVNRHAPRLTYNSLTGFAGNLVYNYGDGLLAGGGSGKPLDYGLPAVASLVGNRFVAGPDTPTDRPFVSLHEHAVGPRLFRGDSPFEPGDVTFTPPARTVTEAEPFDPEGEIPPVTLLAERPTWPEGLSAPGSDEVVEHVDATASARPAARDDADARIVDEVLAGENSVIDGQGEVGGYPAPEPTERALDPPADGDGLGGWLAQHARAVTVADASPP